MSDSERFAVDSETPGVDLNIAEQLALLEVFKQLHDEAPFSPNPDAGWRTAPERAGPNEGSGVVSRAGSLTFMAGPS